MDQACIAKRSFSRVGEQGVAFASPDGIVLVGPGGGRLLSRDAWDRKTWRELSPEDLRGTYHDEAYVGFLVRAAGAGFAFSREFEGAVTLTDDVLAAYRDLDRDTIFVVSRADRRVREWRAQGTGAARTMRWRGRLHVGRRRTFSAAQVVAEAYPVTFRLFTEAGMAFEKTVQNASPFRLGRRPGGGSLKLASNWQYEVEGTQEVEEVRVGSMMDML